MLFMAIILILGNGVSRLVFDKEIRAFTGDVWGCNRVYLDFGDKLTGLAGHVEVMEEARDYRKRSGQHWDIIGSDENPYTCRDIYRKDTGTTLVAEALTRGHDVIACGFDIGGPDLYSPGHEKKDKTPWVNRWRLILNAFGQERITFWGHDHKPYLLSGNPASAYSSLYMRGKAHIEGDEYDKAFSLWDRDYSRIWRAVPLVLFCNTGTREWTFAEIRGPFSGGRSVVLPECVAKRYATAYPGQFTIKPLPD